MWFEDALRNCLMLEALARMRARVAFDEAARARRQVLELAETVYGERFTSLSEVRRRFARR